MSQSTFATIRRQPLAWTHEEALLNFQSVHEYLLSQSGAFEDRPFGPDVPVYKIGNKMFAYASPHDVPPSITLKLDPLLGQMLRSTYPAVKPGYHMNKEHWNTITLNRTVSQDEVFSWIDESYSLVRSKLTKRVRAQLEALPQNEGRS